MLKCFIAKGPQTYLVPRTGEREARACHADKRVALQPLQRERARSSLC